MLALFNDTYGHVFALDAGDIDLRDVVHNDRILAILIPALEISGTEAAALGRLYVSQLAMILSQDLGEKLEGKPEDIMVVRKYKDRFPFLWICDEVGACYTEKLGELATQIRSLGYCLLLAGQEAQRLKSAAGDRIWTLIANMGTRITGKIMDPKDTLEILQLMAGTEYLPEMSHLVRQNGTMGSRWDEGDTLQLREQKKVSVEEVQKLQEGENITLFRGEVIRGSSLYIADADKFTKEAIRINRFIEVAPPSLDALLAQAPLAVRRRYLVATLAMVPCALAAPSVQVGFSPEGSALQLVLNTLNTAQSSIRLMGYSFTSPEVVRALVGAKRRGVDVKVVLDEKGNQNTVSQAAMNLLVNADIPVRTVDKFKIMHDKTIVCDNKTTGVGSFNFSRAAATANSENVLVLHDMPAVAHTYLIHWQSRWDIGKDWRSSY